MLLKTITNDRGIAVLVTLSIVTVLIVAALEMNRRTRSAVYSAAATRDRLTLLQMSSSGIHIAQALLIEDKKDSDVDSMQEDWANAEKVNQVLQDIHFEDGTVTVTISDELGRIQVNSLVQFPEGLQFNEPQKALWERLLWVLMSQNEPLEDIESAMVINSLKDWLDSGDDDTITGVSGAESDYYQDLDPPYACGNGVFTHMDELALVRGITPQLYQGTAEMPGISSYVTVHGITTGQSEPFTYEGKININTAEIPVLAALLPSGSEDLAEAIYDYRQETSDNQYVHDLASSNWYKKVPGMGDITIDPNLITTTSDVFRIESAAELNAVKMTVTAIVKREKNQKTGKWDCKVLHWQVE